MSSWVIIPIKCLNEAKTSLKEIRPENREKLVLAMLTDMLNVIGHASSISGAAVVSPDKKVLDLVSSRGTVAVVDPGLGLNGALKLAIKQVIGLGASSVLIFPGDLPLLKTDDVDNLNTMAINKHDVVIAPSKANGTNALLLQPPDIIDLKFGGESFPLHLAEVIRSGINPRIYRSPTVAFDVDETEDLLKIESSGGGTATYNFLLSLRQK